MRVFRIENGVEPYRYEGTKSEAHKFAKDEIDKADWPEVKISELDVQTDKDGIICALNNSVIFKVVNEYGLTKRGGLEPWKE